MDTNNNVENQRLTWEDEQFDEAIDEIGSLGKQKKYNKAIDAAKLLYRSCDPNDHISVLWSVGPIILGYLSIAYDRNEDPIPGTQSYLDLRKYLKILLTAYYSSPSDVQEEYLKVDANFKIYAEMMDILDNNRTFSELSNTRKPLNNQKSGCLSILIILIIFFTLLL